MSSKFVTYMLSCVLEKGNRRIGRLSRWTQTRLLSYGKCEIYYVLVYIINWESGV